MVRLLDVQPPRENWQVEIIDQRLENGLVLFEYAVRAPGQDPFILNNHRAQIRTDHQRVRRGPNGGLMHVSGTEVLPADIETFENSNANYNWIRNADGSIAKDSQGRWRATRGRSLAPFTFTSAPWAGSRVEELDPQWQRETYTVTMQSQIDKCVNRFLNRAQRRNWVGDRRGTTLNLVVGASADDGLQITDDTVSITGSLGQVDTTTEHVGVRFQNVTIAGGSTINSAILSVDIASTLDDEPQHQLRGEASDNASAFTTGSNNIDSRSRTTATVQWSSANLGSGVGETWEWGAAAGAPTAGADISSIIQEITDRGGWASGNSLVLIWEQFAPAASNRDLSVYFWDHSTENPPALDIDYTAGGGTAIKDIIGGGFINGPR